MEIWRATTLHDWFDVESIYRKFTVTIASIPFSFLFYFAANVGCRRPLLLQRSTRTSRSHKVWCIWSDNGIHVSINYHFLFDYEVVCLKQLCEYLLPSRVVWLCCTFHMYNVVATRCFLYPRMQSIFIVHITGCDECRMYSKSLGNGQMSSCTFSRAHPFHRYQFIVNHWVSRIKISKFTRFVFMIYSLSLIVYVKTDGWARVHKLNKAKINYFHILLVFMNLFHRSTSSCCSFIAKLIIRIIVPINPIHESFTITRRHNRKLVSLLSRFLKEAKETKTNCSLILSSGPIDWCRRVIRMNNEYIFTWKS